MFTHMPDPIEMLRSRMTDKSLRSLAKEMSISAAYLSDVMLGKRRPGPAVLDFLGLERKTEITYKRGRRS